MRALLAAAVLLSAGCVAPGLTSTTTSPLALVELPEGAEVAQIEGGLRLVFDAVEFPFEVNVTIPAGTTIVRASGLVAGEAGVSVSMRHAETERRRCNFAPLDAWDARVLGLGTCSGVAIVDALPATWTVRGVSGAKEGRVEVDLLATPLDGALAGLDVSQLSLREHQVAGTQALRVPSFDGTELHVEVTLPAGEGPWPTIVASSPYNHETRVATGKPAMWSYFTRDWAERGYAVVNADVRGYGFSDGCVEVWGVNEQRDQSFLVEWVAKQPWSDGNVGFYGQSYVATTPVEAAVRAPDALKAIIAVAPVLDVYNDWHFGGVPNGESVLSPLAYETIGAGVDLPPIPSRDPLRYAAWAQRMAGDAPAMAQRGDLAYASERADNGFCDPGVLLRPNDPRALYDAFYVERNFSARAAEVRAAVLYTQGFEDSNVKSALIPDWFNALQAPKLGLFGHWVHQHPTRADNEALFLLWFDQHLKGRPVGFESQPSVRVVTNDGRERVAEAWPPEDAPSFALHLDVRQGALSRAQGTGSASIVMDGARGALPVSLADVPVARTLLALESEPLDAPVHLAGQGQVHLAASLEDAQNAHVAAYLYQVDGDERSLVTWGMFNLAHRFGHDRYEPVQLGERVQVGIPLLPTEWVFPEGASLHLELRGANVDDWSLLLPQEPGALQVHADGSMLELPTAEGAHALPATAQR